MQELETAVREVVGWLESNMIRYAVLSVVNSFFESDGSLVGLELQEAIVRVVRSKLCPFE